MEKDTNRTKACNACGKHHAVANMRPFGRAAGGQVITWVCENCLSPRVVTPARPHLAWETVARAERLATLGAGWTADEVMRRALALLEAQHVAALTKGGSHAAPN